MSRVFEFLNQDALKPFRFLLVGLIATAVHLFVANVILWFFDTSPYLANMIAFLLAFFFSFYGHRYLTFKVDGVMWKFFLVAISGFLINNFILSILLFFGLRDMVSLTIATLSVPVITYLASSLWAFNGRV